MSIATTPPAAANAAARRPHAKSRRSVGTQTPLVRSGRNAQVSLELRRQVALIGETGHRRDERARQPLGEEPCGVPDSRLHEVLMR
jgi:hypothetical protein